ncbi:T9SS type A sorting domain-containing protein [Echinicola sp. CAU 1574]|uniref:T9SS type A sorting domain-containing protein n=1 Tax=Echinicola arenosa TaxID=2774144 RepID=A0ABR9ALZ1_9BACT|nr:T9SS type A sorting domain-containing protein [Echinicola arenosa]
MEHVSSHEMGHCLNLFHTFQGTMAGTPGCAEAINGSNCNSCGDLVCDTPADDGFGTTFGFNPDLTNIMSYYPDADHFTNGQGQRMLLSIANSSLLSQTIGDNCSIPILSGDESLCYSAGGTTYTLQNGGNSVTWQVPSNVQILSSSNSSITVRPNNSSTTGTGEIQAILPFETLSLNVSIGKLNAGNIEIWNSTETTYPYNTTPTNTPVEFTLGYPPGNRCDILDVEWQQVSGVTIMNGSFPCVIDNNSNKLMVFHQPGTYYIRARILNCCGWSNWSLPVTMEVTSGSYMYSVYPNPSSETLYIKEQFEGTNSEIKSLDSEVKSSEDTFQLYDSNSNLVLEGKINGNKSIDVSKFMRGRYILKLLSNGAIESHHIILE